MAWFGGGCFTALPWVLLMAIQAALQVAANPHANKAATAGPTSLSHRGRRRTLRLQHRAKIAPLANELTPDSGGYHGGELTPQPSPRGSRSNNYLVQKQTSR
jgi:hypothetical protein